MVDHSDSTNTGRTFDDTLPPSEATDSDELRNDDGDQVVTAPEQWQPGHGPAARSLDDKLAAEEPDVAAAAGAGDDRDDQGAPVHRHRGQIGGAPEDGESFFTVQD